MGRRKLNYVQTEKQKVDWIFKLDIDIDLSASSKTPIAFLSGLGRSYYPEDPGFSKFSLVYQLNIDDNPPCKYAPPTDRLYGRPISSRGFGIGGLDGPRFAPDYHIDNPSPDKYQPEVVTPLLEPHRKKLHYEDDVYQLSPRDPYVIRKKVHEFHQKRRQCTVGFGSLKTKPRFGNPSTFNTAGVGSYNVAGTEPFGPIATSAFGRQPITHELSTDIKCVCAKNEMCIECGRSLSLSDYYRTRFVVRIPFPETRHRSELGKNFPRGTAHVNLCNVCYYRATQGGSKNWPKGKLKWMFKKTRTCPTMRDTEGPAGTQSSDRKTTRRLQLKESILSKYYKDRVEESIMAR